MSESRIVGRGDDRPEVCFAQFFRFNPTLGFARLSRRRVKLWSWPTKYILSRLPTVDATTMRASVIKQVGNKRKLAASISS